MNVTADPTTPLGLGTYAWDDEGVPGERRPVVKAGILEGFLASRETAAHARRGPAAARCGPTAGAACRSSG